MTDQAPRYDVEFEVQGSADALAIPILLSSDFRVEVESTDGQDPEENQSIFTFFQFVISGLNQEMATAVVDYLQQDKAYTRAARIIPQQETVVFSSTHLQAA